MCGVGVAIGNDSLGFISSGLDVRGKTPTYVITTQDYQGLN